CIALLHLHGTELLVDPGAGPMDRQNGGLIALPEVGLAEGLANEAGGAADRRLEESVLRAVEGSDVLLLGGREPRHRLEVAYHVQAPREGEAVIAAKQGGRRGGRDRLAFA